MKIFFMGILCVVVTGCTGLMSSVIEFPNGVTGIYGTDGSFLEGQTRFFQGGEHHGTPNNSPGPDFVYEPGVLENPDSPYGPNNRFVGDSWYNFQTNTRVAWTHENFYAERRAAKKRWRRAATRDSTSIPPQYARKKNKRGQKNGAWSEAADDFNNSGFNFHYNNPANPVNPFRLPKYQNYSSPFVP